MTYPKIWLDEPWIHHKDIDAVACALYQDQFSTAHQMTNDFEKAASDYLGVTCVATNSGTSALHLALMTAGIGYSDTVLMPVLSFVATANAVKYVGAKIEFCDVNRETWMISGILGKTMPVVPVWLYGGGFEITHWNSGFPIIFDVAEGMGLRLYEAKPVPHCFFCFSLNGNKTITGGAGGLVACEDIDEIQSIRAMIHPRTYDGLAYNYRMPSLNAALALSQLKRLPEEINRKIELAKLYRSLLPDLEFQEDNDKGCWMVGALFPSNVDIDNLMEKLKDNGIPTRRVFKPMNQYSHLKDGKRYPNAEYIYEHGLLLPTSTRNSDEAIGYVCETIKKMI